MKNKLILLSFLLLIFPLQYSYSEVNDECLDKELKRLNIIIPNSYSFDDSLSEMQKFEEILKPLEEICIHWKKIKETCDITIDYIC